MLLRHQLLLLGLLASHLAAPQPQSCQMQMQIVEKRVYILFVDAFGARTALGVG
jgi:hypothetical protein